MADSSAATDPMRLFNVHKGLRQTTANSPGLTRDGRLRLNWLEWHRSHGATPA